MGSLDTDKKVINLCIKFVKKKSLLVEIPKDPETIISYSTVASQPAPTPPVTENSNFKIEMSFSFCIFL